MSQGSGVDGRPTMVDVGRIAEVSAQTVSRYFTGGYVGAGTRDRIERAVAELGYRPNSAARRLKSNRAEAIGIIAMGHPNFGIWTILEGMTAAVRQAGFTLVIGQLDIIANEPGTPNELGSAIEQLLRAGVDGVIVATPYPRSEDLLSDLVADIPMIVISERPTTPRNSVRTDSYTAGLLAMRHLVELGHRRILHLGGDQATAESAEREAGYRDGLAEAHLDALPVLRKDWSADAGYEFGRTVDVDSFTGVFAANDQIASGFMSAMRERGLHAPDDYSVIGIDDAPESRFYAPPLTSVALDQKRLGAIAVESLLKLIHDDGPVEQIKLAPRLRVRRSTAEAVATDGAGSAHRLPEPPPTPRSGA